MYYRSYGLLLLIVALLVMTQAYRDRMEMGLIVGGLILCIDLPLRFLGHIVPWRNDDVTMWYVSPYRGSHIFFLPTWLVGAALLGLALACIQSPDLSERLQRRGDKPQANAKKNEQPLETKPQPAAGKLELKIEELPPFNRTAFRYIMTNNTGGAITNTSEAVEYRSGNANPTFREKRRPQIFQGETCSEKIQIIGPSATRVYVNVGYTSAEKKAVTVETEWNAPNP